MFLNVWQFARGYVTVEVTGFTIERFLNMAAFHGVYLWDVSRTGDGMVMRVSIPGFKLLKNCARKTQCKIRIQEKKGYPFIMHRYRRRKILWGGILFFVLGLYALSSFVWRIDVAGRERLEQERILSFCENNGLKIGAFKYMVNHRQLQRDLQLHFPEIAWADVHTKGTRTTITISESIPKQPLLDKETPCHIMAAKDGLITGIVTGSGKPLVRQHDVVKQGEMLVSGVIELNTETHGQSQAYVHAYAEVWAKRFTPINFTVPYDYMEKQYTGRRKTAYELQLLFLRKQPLTILNTSISFESYDKITRRTQPGVSGDYPMPFIWVSVRYDEFVSVPRTRNAAEAKELAERMLTGRILREFEFASDIIDKSVQYFETTDGLQVEAIITTNERIDVAVPINLTPEPQEIDVQEVFEPFE